MEELVPSLLSQSPEAQSLYERAGDAFNGVEGFDTPEARSKMMHPEDFITRVGPELFSDIGMLQDSEQMLQHGGRYFDFENNAEDREHRTLSNYFNDVFGTLLDWRNIYGKETTF